jgi:hypothetical protein
MSVDRNISLRIVTKREQFSDLFIDFVKGFLAEDPTFEMTSVAKDDTDLMDGIVFNDFESLKEVLDYRQHKKYHTSVTIYSENIGEAIYIGAEKYSSSPARFSLDISPGVGKRIPDSERITDYGFYLCWIIPRLMELDCSIYEVVCKDEG